MHHQTLERLHALRLPGMAAFFRSWLEQPKTDDVTVEAFVGLLADAEWVYRENKKLQARLKQAKLRQHACVEDVDYALQRGLTKSIMSELMTSRWVAERQNIIITGPTGLGKSYLACALGNKACRDGFSVIYRRTCRLFDELVQARADGSYASLMRRLAKANVLILDDYAVEPMGGRDRRELLEVLEDRYGVSSTIISTQLEPDQWHAAIGDETLADAICDRLIHNAHRLRLHGESVRKTKGLTEGGEKGKAK